MMRRWLVAAGMIAALMFAACGGGDDDEQTIDTGDGEVTIGDDLPDDFPDDFPVYDGADVQGSYRGEQDGIEGSITTWTTGDSYDDVVAFYESEFEGGPWSSEGDSSFSGSGSGSGGFTFWSVAHEDGEQVAYVSVTDGDDVSILAAIGDDTSATDGGDDGSGDDGSDDGSGDDGSGDDGSGDDGTDDGSGDDGSGGDADVPDEVELSDDFPADAVEFPDGARIVSANRIASGGTVAWTVTVYSQDTIDELADYFKSEIEGNGYTETSNISSSDTVSAVYATNPDGSGDLVILTINPADIEGWNMATVQVQKAE